MRLPASALLTLALAGPGFAAVLTDDFNDNARGPSWSQIEDAPARLSVSETNGRLEGQSTTAAASHEDAIYLSDGPGGFRVSTASDFTAKVNYAVTDVDGAASAGSNVSMQFGVGTDPSGDNSAAIVVAIFSAGGFPAAQLGTASRTGNVNSPPQPVGSSSLTGTLYISYAATSDTLYFSHTGFFTGNAYPGLVRGGWNADDLLIGIGFRGGGVALGPGDAFFDNFELATGSIPEPASASLLLLAAAPLLRRSRAS